MSRKYLNSSGLGRVWSKSKAIFATKRYVDDVAKEILSVSFHGVYCGAGVDPVPLFSGITVSRMWIDGIRVTPIAEYTFNDYDFHDVWMRIDGAEIAHSAFAGCNGAVVAAITGGFIRGIGDSAFEGNLTLETVVLHAEIEGIKNYAFKDCVNLKKFVVMSSTPPDVGIDAFSTIGNPSILYVPADAIPAYSNAGWCNYFSDIQSVDKWRKLNLE